MKNLTNLISLMIIAVLMTACGVSPEEKEQRRANAFDIAGRYEVEVTNQTSEEMVLQIDNEGDRSNVYGIIERNGFSQKEVDAFDRQNIPLSSVDKLRTRFALGKGRHNWIEGGENISDDLGQSSRLYIRTHGKEDVSYGSYDIDYSISANISKSDFVLRGTLILTIEKNVVTDNGYSWELKEKVEIPFTAKNKGLFYKQYFGTWEGLLDVETNSVHSAFKNIVIGASGDEDYRVTSGVNTITYNGTTYRKIVTRQNLETLSDNENPEIYLEYVSNNDETIFLMGNIYSLGLFVGVIAHTDADGNTEQIGNFQFKRR